METFISTKGHTGLIYDERMVEHRCLWAPHPECPERFTRVLDRCHELGLISRCKILKPRAATEEEILAKHSKKHYELLKSTSNFTDEETIENLCTKYSSIYLHPSTFEQSCLAAGSVIELVNNIVQNRVQNGMAIVRPPGHHCMESEFNGFCFLNNVSLAAQSALNQGVKRILILDWDVHHGQGIQKLFYDDSRVLYFSIHRYEYGIYWPHLRESNFDAIGDGAGKGFNFNLPLNQKGATNGEYLAIFQQILIPVADEFQPELILVAAGYDAAYGCPLGEMEVSPACYAHLLSPLMNFADGKIAVALEGGYCLDSLSEGAAITLKTLLGDPCPNLIEPMQIPRKSVQDSIYNCIWSHRPYWKCLQINQVYNVHDKFHEHLERHEVTKLMIDTAETNDYDDYGMPRHETRRLFNSHTDADEVINMKALYLEKLKKLTNLDVPVTRVCYSNDHSKSIDVFLDKCGLLKRLQLVLPTREVNLKELEFILPKNINKKTAFESIGSFVKVIDNVLSGTTRSGFCISQHDEDLFNQISVGTQYCIKQFGLKRVILIDWNTSNVNGKRRFYESSPEVLCINIQSNTKEKGFRIVEENEGKGYTLNIPLIENNLNNMDLTAIVQRIIMPIAYEYNPEIVFISANIGQQLNVNLSQFFGRFIHWLSSLANGRIIVNAVNNECNSNVSTEILSSIKTLLGDPISAFTSNQNFNHETIDLMKNIMLKHKDYWNCLKFNRMLPEDNIEVDEIVISNRFS